MEKQELNIAFFQQDIAWERPEENYRIVQEFFSSMPVGYADILVVPETFNTGFSDTMAVLAEPQEGPTLQFARGMAARYEALFVGTWPVREGGQVYNRLHWVRPDGSFGIYDKGHTFRMSSEAAQLTRGTRRALFTWRGWRIKPAVCYDLRFPLWLRNGVPADQRHLIPDDCTARPDGTVALDYDLLLVCANWPASRHEAWETLLRARAIENLCYVVGVNRVGIDGANIPYSGHSQAIDFKGLPLVACTPGVPQVSLATLSRTQLETFRQHWPFYLDFDTPS